MSNRWAGKALAPGERGFLAMACAPVEQCGVGSEITAFICTREKGHGGDHAAHTDPDEQIDRWPQSDKAPASEAEVKRERGWYWVKIDSDWVVAELYGDGEWYTCGNEVGYGTAELEQIGERIPGHG